MGFAVSPGVTVREFDLTTVVPGVQTTVAGYAGVFRWGPINQPVIVDSESTLSSRFGTPATYNAEGWFSVASFLSYSSSALVVRAANCSTTAGANAALTAVANVGPVTNLYAQVVLNDYDYVNKDGTFATGVQYVARYPGALGNSLRISVCDNPNTFMTAINLASIGTGSTLALNVGSNVATITIQAASITAANAAAIALQNQINVTDVFSIGNSSIGTQGLKVTAVNYSPANNSFGNVTTGNAVVSIAFEIDYRLSTDFLSTGSVNKYWEFSSLMNQAPGVSPWMAQYGNAAITDEMHVVVVDQDGLFTGTPGTVLEVYSGLSRCTDAENPDGEDNYYKDVLNGSSKYVWWASDRSGAASALAVNLTPVTTSSILSINFVGGQDGSDETSVSVGTLAAAYNLFANPEQYDIGLVITGKARGGTNGGQLANYLIDNLATTRKDCVVFCSPDKSCVVNNAGNEAFACVAFRNTLRSTSYGFLDSGYKYMYDRYNDVYRYVPLNGDMAGLAALTEVTNDAWWSPAGFNRGNLKNLVRLAYNPGKADRDVLYKSNINPVVSFPGLGTVLYGDKTLLTKPSAFDRINVRRLFIVLEKAIATAAKYSLFEFNDPFTRAQFRNMVTPFLRDVKGRRGLKDFLVVCDETNNPGSVVDRNEFVGDIYLKPARSINFITLNFVAVGTDTQFTEVVGQYGGSSAVS